MTALTTAVAVSPVPAISVSFTPGDWGTLQPSVAGVTTNVATTRQGLDFEWDAVFLDLQWGLKTSEKLAVGATLMRFNLRGLPWVLAVAQSMAFGLHFVMTRLFEIDLP